MIKSGEEIDLKLLISINWKKVYKNILKNNQKNNQKVMKKMIFQVFIKD